MPQRQLAPDLCARMLPVEVDSIDVEGVQERNGVVGVVGDLGLGDCMRLGIAVAQHVRREEPARGGQRLHQADEAERRARSRMGHIEGRPGGFIRASCETVVNEAAGDSNEAAIDTRSHGHS
jgi:hypothetical protein